jgi:hypothetical protein
MGDAIASSNRLATSNRQLQSDLESASGRAASLERTVINQQRDIEAGRRGLEDLATGLTEGLGDLRSRAVAIREIVTRLYAIYQKGPG